MQYVQWKSCRNIMSVHRVTDVQSQEDGFMVLLVVDTQKGIMDDRLYEFEKVRGNINLLISEARKK